MWPLIHWVAGRLHASLIFVFQIFHSVLLSFIHQKIEPKEMNTAKSDSEIVVVKLLCPTYQNQK